MLAYIVRRMFLSLFTIWVISILAFVIIELPPGDQVDRFKEVTESRRRDPGPRADSPPAKNISASTSRSTSGT